MQFLKTTLNFSKYVTRNYSVNKQLWHYSAGKKCPFLCNTCPNLRTDRWIRSSRHNSKNIKDLKTPDLIYIPHILRWFKTKLRLKYLQKTWDPEFSEGAFIYGSTRAVCRITEIINEGSVEELNGLLTQSAKLKLIQDMKSKLTEKQKQIIRLKPEDIKILVPISVILRTEGSRRKCDITLRTLALKWFEQASGSLRLVLVAIQTEFRRDYTEGTESEWTIGIFDVLECATLSDAPAEQ